MKHNKVSNNASNSKSKKGILLGIPFLIFVCGVAILTIGFYDYFKSAYYISGIFLTDTVKLETKSLKNESLNSKDEMTYPSYGEKLGELTIDSAKVNTPVFVGDDEKLLLKGAGFFFGSSFPGRGGNVVVSGHTNTVFRNLEYVKLGDVIRFDTTYGSFEYKVSNMRVVDTSKGDNSFILPLPTEKLTLYTCYPFNYLGLTSQRYVILCDFVKATYSKKMIEMDKVVEE